MKEALIMTRDVLLFKGEMGGWAPDDIIEAVHKIDEALGNGWHVHLKLADWTGEDIPPDPKK